MGEGANAGTPATFIRLAGCNLKCPWCDTKHEVFKSLEEYSITIGKADWVVITGGEPLIQDLDFLMSRLKSLGKWIQIETNGTFPLPLFVKPDWLAVSPKPWGILNLETLAQADELKFIVDKDFTMEWALGIADKAPKAILFLQPQAGHKPSLKRCLDLLKAFPGWRLSIQLHKMIGVR